MSPAARPWAPLALMLALTGCQAFSGATPGTSQSASPQVAGEVIVKFKPETSMRDREALRHAHGVQQVDAILPDTERWAIQGDATALRTRLSRDAAFEYAEPNYLRRTLAYEPPEATSQYLWYLRGTRGIDMNAAWNSASFATASQAVPPGKGVTIAVVDTGVDAEHPDLAPNIAKVPANLAENYPKLAARAATSSAGAPFYLDEVDGDTTLGTGNTSYAFKDGNGHGTHVAGILGAAGHNGGIVGVAPGVSILPVKVMRADGSGSDFTIAQGLKDAADAGADIINLSVGGPEPSQLLADVLAYGMAKGVTMVIASGNGYGPVFYPAAYAGVICVGSTSGKDGSPTSIPPYSNRGPEVSLVAPGGNNGIGDASKYNDGIYSTLPTYSFYEYQKGRLPLNYGVLTGTSMATPVVSGVAALVIADAKARGQKLSPAQVRARLIATAKPLVPSGFSNETGYGLVDPLKALQWSAAGGNQ
ncbi:S8 family serine peptidase [bacterium]|nr:S8 family serine peptidase [bacterium]